MFGECLGRVQLRDEWDQYVGLFVGLLLLLL